MSPRTGGYLLQPFPIGELPSGLPHPIHEEGIEPLPFHRVEQRLLPGFGEGAAQVEAQLHPANLIFQDRAQVRGQELEGLDGQAAGTDFDPGKNSLVEDERFQTPLEQLVGQGGSSRTGADDDNLATEPREESWSSSSGGGAPMAGKRDKKQLILVPWRSFVY